MEEIKWMVFCLLFGLLVFGSGVLCTRFFLYFASYVLPRYKPLRVLTVAEPSPEGEACFGSELAKNQNLSELSASQKADARLDKIFNEEL
jgi:hypothetical protein